MKMEYLPGHTLKQVESWNVNSILLTIILLLKESNPDSPANTNAAKMFLNDYHASKKQ